MSAQPEMLALNALDDCIRTLTSRIEPHLGDRASETLPILEIYRAQARLVRNALLNGATIGLALDMVRKMTNKGGRIILEHMAAEGVEEAQAMLDRNRLTS